MEEPIEQTQNTEGQGMGPGEMFSFLTPPKQGGTSLLSPEAVVMMTIGITLDFLSIICAILILAFGIGLFLSKIVYAIGLVIVTAWSIFRGGGIQKAKGEVSKQISKGISSFLKKYKKNLITKAIPAIGDVVPLWTFTIYTELKG